MRSWLRTRSLGGCHEDRQGYEDGPRTSGPEQGIILHVPSDGSPAHLDEATWLPVGDGAGGQEVIELRTGGKSAARVALSNCHDGRRRPYEPRMSDLSSPEIGCLKIVRVTAGGWRWWHGLSASDWLLTLTWLAA